MTLRISVSFRFHHCATAASSLSSRLETLDKGYLSTRSESVSEELNTILPLLVPCCHLGLRLISQRIRYIPAGVAGLALIAWVRKALGAVAAFLFDLDDEFRNLILRAVSDGDYLGRQLT